MACLGRVQRHLHGFQVAHLPDQDDVRILAERGAEGLGEAQRVLADLALADHALVVLVDVLDGILDGEDVVVPAAVHEADHGGQRRGLPGAGDAGDQDHAAPLHAQPLEHLGEIQVLEGRVALRYVAEDRAHLALAQKGVDAEAPDPRQPVAHVDLPALQQHVVALLAEQGHDGTAHELLVHGRQIVLDLEMAVDPHDRLAAGLQMQVRGLPLRALGQELLEVHGSLLSSSEGRSAPLESKFSPDFPQKLSKSLLSLYFS